MQHAALAQQFEDVSNGLRASGHGIIMRKARALLERGDTDAAMAFLEKAGARMRDDGLGALHGAVQSWAEAGGDAAALAAEPMWIASRAREDRGARLITEVLEAGEDLNDMVDGLALEKMALGEKEGLASLPPMPERVEMPDEPPTVEPEAPVAAVEPEAPVADAAPEAPVEPAVADEAPAAAIEKPTDLEARPADFDGPAAEPEAPVEPAVADEAPAVEPEAPVEPAVADEAPAEPAVADEAPAEPAVADEAPTAEPEATADFGKGEPAEVATTNTTTPQEQGGGMGLYIVLALALAAGAYYYFFMR